MTKVKRTPTQRPLSRAERKQFKQDQNAWKPFADAVVRAGIRVLEGLSNGEARRFCLRAGR